MSNMDQFKTAGELAQMALTEKVRQFAANERMDTEMEPPEIRWRMGIDRRMQLVETKLATVDERINSGQQAMALIHGNFKDIAGGLYASMAELKRDTAGLATKDDIRSLRHLQWFMAAAIVVCLAAVIFYAAVRK